MIGVILKLLCASLLSSICLVSALWTPALVSAEPSPLIQAIEQAFPPEQQGMAMYIAMRESRGDCSIRIIDTNNEISAGCWQVQAVWWGEVSEDVNEQAHQVWLIVQEHGWEPWTTYREN